MRNSRENRKGEGTGKTEGNYGLLSSQQITPRQSLKSMRINDGQADSPLKLKVSHSDLPEQVNEELSSQRPLKKDALFSLLHKVQK